MTLEGLRERIDAIDDALLARFDERMEVVRQIGELKRERGLPVGNATREQMIVLRLTENRDARSAERVKALYAEIFAISRALQEEEQSVREKRL